MTDSSEVQDAVRARQQEVAELAEAANEAASSSRRSRVSAASSSLKWSARPRLAALGDKHLGQPVKTITPVSGSLNGNRCFR
jgi:hypothetical protein